jgi:hypothetical protein
MQPHAICHVFWRTTFTPILPTSIHRVFSTRLGTSCIFDIADVAFNTQRFFTAQHLYRGYKAPYNPDHWGDFVMTTETVALSWQTSAWLVSLYKSIHRCRSWENCALYGGQECQENDPIGCSQEAGCEDYMYDASKCIQLHVTHGSCKWIFPCRK